MAAITSTFPASDSQIQSEPVKGNRLENPYLAARREWDERYGHLVTRERNWRVMALVCAVSSVLAIVGMIRLSTRSHIVLFVVANDSLGLFVAAGVAEQASSAD